MPPEDRLRSCLWGLSSSAEVPATSQSGALAARKTVVVVMAVTAAAMAVAVVAAANVA